SYDSYDSYDHGGDGGGDDRPPPHESAEGCRGKGTRKPNLGGRKAGRIHTRKETRNLELRKIMDELGPQPIRFEWKDNGTMLPLGKNSTHWANLLGEIVRGFLMHFGSWRNILPERKAGVLEKIEVNSVLVSSQEHGPVYSKCSKPGKEHGRMPAGIPDTCCPPRYADAELSDSRVPVSNPDLLRNPYRGRRILAGRGSMSICIFDDDFFLMLEHVILK
nr:hypothetical protein [Tanacetum cinerariifolium]